MILQGGHAILQGGHVILQGGHVILQRGSCDPSRGYVILQVLRSGSRFTRSPDIRDCIVGSMRKGGGGGGRGAIPRFNTIVVKDQLASKILCANILVLYIYNVHAHIHNAYSHN